MAGCVLLKKGENKMEWLQKYKEIMAILITVIGGFFWLNNKFECVNAKFSAIEKDIAVIKTVLIMKNIMPQDLAKEGK